VQPEDWYMIGLPDLRNLGLGKDIHAAGLVNVIIEKYPKLDRENIKIKDSAAEQQRLEHAVTTLFPVSTHVWRYTF